MMSGGDFPGGQLWATELEHAGRQLRRYQAMSAETTGSAESDDGLITVTVGLYGDVRELTLDPRIYRDADAGALGERLRDVLNEAAREAQQAAVRQLSALFPDGTGDPSEIAFGPMLAEISKAGKAAAR
ncbi:YbaB/EbfC family nucleoid-associated protein [Kribbella sp. CA-293567]|uniref:YbaB/EbfC family nucleoid-associated protein n=1 Tax=Kribbella sp. CA-293567 TaxID=3002436 RepID=UPI0022DDBBE2|nr:YbaB/EbfC family nucleoid-associated protein [Kribbella sp. CA-293567]WBQ08437.1 YbaB/EbfC family nucleoid-associated protein [Kribbella sp. CA-293567]